MIYVDLLIMNLHMFPVNSILRRLEDVQISGIVGKIDFNQRIQEKNVLRGWIQKNPIYTHMS